jgi:hypothetical protein
MVTKKSARNNNRTSKKPAPSEGKVLTKSDKLLQNVSNKCKEKISQAQKDHIKLGLEWIRKNQESIDEGSLNVGFNCKNFHFKDGNNKSRIPEMDNKLLMSCLEERGINLGN